MSGLLHKFRAWWEGYDLQQLEQDSDRDGDLTDLADQEDIEPGSAEGWTVSRVAATQRVFGRGFDRPGGDDALKQLLAPLGMNETMSAIDLTAGLGATTRYIAGETGAWVESFIEDPVLAEAAKRLAHQGGLAKKAAIQNVRFDAGKQKKASCDVVFGLEPFFQVEKKADAFRDVHGLLKPGGSLYFADFMSKTSAVDSIDVGVWSSFERIDPHLTGIDEVREVLEEFGFEVHIAEETTDEYRHLTLAALHQFAQSLEQEPIAAPLRPWVLWEVELWARRVALLESGDVGMYRVHARLQDTAD